MEQQRVTHELLDLLERLLDAGWYCVFIPFEQSWGCALARGEASFGVAQADTLAEALLQAFRHACRNAEHSASQG
jgi:hypothetical protein